MILWTRSNRLRNAGCALLLTSLLATAARAEPSGDKAAAEAVFREGRDLMDKGSFADACPKFEKSLALYQSASAAMNLARCYGKTNRLAAALTTLERAVELNRKTEDTGRRLELDKLAEQSKKEIEPRVPRVRVVVVPEVQGTVVQRNGVELPAPMLGRPIPVDPGSTVIRVMAPGYREVVKTSLIQEGESTLIEVRLVREADGPESGLVSKGGASVPVTAAPSADTSTKATRSRWPWVVGAGGFIALGVGAGFAIDYGAARGKLADACPQNSCPRGSESQVQSIRGQWDRDLALTIVGGGVGAGLLVAAGVGMLSARAGSEPPTKNTKRASSERGVFVVPSVGPTFVGTAAVGRF